MDGLEGASLPVGEALHNGVHHRHGGTSDLVEETNDERASIRRASKESKLVLQQYACRMPIDVLCSPNVIDVSVLADRAHYNGWVDMVLSLSNQRNHFDLCLWPCALKPAEQVVAEFGDAARSWWKRTDD